MYNESGVVRDGGVLDFCRLNKVTIQPWSPMQYGFCDILRKCNQLQGQRILQDLQIV